MVKTSAPGKLMLFGDHSVVHNRPCIVTAVDHRISAIIEKNNSNKIIINAPDLEIKYETSINDLEKEHPRKVVFAITAIKNFFKKYRINSGLNITTKSEFSSEFGLGSSSAVTVDVIKGLSELFKIRISDKEMFDLSYKTVLEIQQVGSGFDVAAAIYGGSLFFVTGGKVIEKVDVQKLPLIVGYTGVKADTSSLVKMVYRELADEPERINKNFNESERIVNEARLEIQKSNWKRVGELMDKNQQLLREIRVSSDELEKLIKAAKDAGAYGAKLSGAGGGDCMIAISDWKKYENIKKAIENAGGKIIDVRLNAEGVITE